MSDLHPQTGPTSIQGKARSSQNALTFGFTACKLIVGDERRQDYDALLDDFLAEFSPETAHARSLVEDAVHARWMLWRKQRAYNAVEAGIYQTEPDEALWTEQIFHRLSLADRYRTNAERAFKRAITNVELLRKTSIAAEERELRHRRWELKLDHANRRITMQEKAFEQGREAQQAGVKLNALHKELAIAKAEDQLGIEKNKLADQAYRRACNGFDKPTFVQNIEVSVSDGHTYTMMDPDNEFLLEYVAIGSTYPIEQIVRKYLFPEGIPPEYYWMTDREDWRNEKQHTVEQAVPLENFRLLAEAEQKHGTGHCLLSHEQLAA